MDLLSLLGELATVLAQEQHWHDGVCDMWRDGLGSGDSEHRQRVIALLARSKEIRRQRAVELQDLASEAPHIAAGLLHLAVKLRTSGEPVSDAICELAARPIPSAPATGRVESDKPLDFDEKDYRVCYMGTWHVSVSRI